MRAILKLGKTCSNEDKTMTLNRAETHGFDLAQLGHRFAQVASGELRLSFRDKMH